VSSLEDWVSAKAAAPAQGTDMGEGVSIDSVEFREVLAHAESIGDSPSRSECIPPGQQPI
jgi:hypothetical protein